MKEFDQDMNISVKNCNLWYGDFQALKNVNIEIPEKEVTAFIGPSGCGKSTFLKILNRMNDLVEGCKIEGEFVIGGVNIFDKETDVNILRKNVGMVFQNPDNQIVSSIVEEDVAFALENLGVPYDEMRKRVDDSLKAVNMYEYRLHSPSQLSGGQKQRVAIAGIIAMRPECIILDEPTAMLDPQGRKEVLSAIHRMNREYGITIVLITHYMEEATQCDRVIVMDKGNIIMDNIPEKVFSQVELLRKIGLDVPQVTELCWELKNAGIEISPEIISEKDCIDALIKLLA